MCSRARSTGARPDHGQARRELRCQPSGAVALVPARGDGRPEPMPRGHAVLALNDQHCHLDAGRQPARGRRHGGFRHRPSLHDLRQVGAADGGGRGLSVVDAVKTFF